MPTLLGLLHYDKPYFAFGKDFFNEPERMSCATNFTGQTYQCISDSLLIYFNGYDVPTIYHFNDSRLNNNIKDLNNVEQQKTFDYFRALLQSYYKCLDKKQFCPYN